MQQKLYAQLNQLIKETVAALYKQDELRLGAGQINGESVPWPVYHAVRESILYHAHHRKFRVRLGRSWSILLMQSRRRHLLCRFSKMVFSN